ncbi:MAG: RNA-binding transcriptional accessory protein [Bacteroidales bacterium]|nr:RNA-binding transcriptional accessory protein [Bacteroidales bacterium]MCF8352308.1 RNA-binding transcriptional accessory protein [Bacteroidales bacterium]MCF8375407.1 RNA-binding transcriptional accessory protein [Bacteroidales bacterium]MCF8400955.1 RNA-binding transcriptional accessory protein [Bacteroidales bacterium]
MQADFSKKIAGEMKLANKQVSNTLNLLAEGATIPFIARYRKELTDSLDEVAITSIRDRHQQLTELEKRKESILKSIEEQDKLTDELKQQIGQAATMTELEDIYLPYKPKRKTRATIARSRGLEPLAKMIMAQKPFDPEAKAAEFIDPEKEVGSAEDALAGARDIIAEWVNENQYARKRMRYLFKRNALITSRVIAGKEAEGEKYTDYFSWEEQLHRSPSHRILAMFRGEKEGVLRIRVQIDQDEALDVLEEIFIKSDNETTEHVEMAIKDAYQRLLAPAMENEFRALTKERADEEAIRVFVANLRQLMMAPPLGQRNVLAIDPGFRTGCKLVCLDRQGNLRHNETIYPHPPQKETKQAIQKINSLVDAYNIEAIAIGNGTGGRETEALIRRMKFKKDVMAVMVNESGASVYSASKTAREEFPQYDVTVRGAVSIGRRLMDPLAEMVKIDPKSIGVGQYQHDVNQAELQKSLEETVVSSVNQVGVEMNTASKELLTHVSGLGPVLAKNILEYRKENGPFKSRKQLMKVPRFGGKAFEQAAGFLRIHNADNPLDSSAVHPESYGVVEKMAKKMNTTIEGLIKNKTLRKEIELKDFITGKTGMPTLLDIMEELDKPGRDPREKFDQFEFDKNVNRMEDVKEGMVLPGIVTNITAFGAFVDIGVHQDGLIHISQMADRFVKDPNEIVKINEKVMVKVMDVDIDRKRIQLSLKDVE